MSRYDSDGNLCVAVQSGSPGGSGGGLTTSEHDALLAQAAALGTTADAAPASTSATGTVPAWLRWIARGVGAPTDAAASSGTGLIGLLQALVARLPASLGATTAAQSLPVTLAPDGTFSVAIGSPSDAAATSDAGSFSLLAFFKRGLQNWTALLGRIPALSNSRVPVEFRSEPVIATVTSISGLAANTTAYGPVIDLGANFGNYLITAQKVAGFNQADTVFIQCAADLLFTTNVTYLPAGNKSNSGTGFSWSNASGTGTTVFGIAVQRYCRPAVVCLTGGSAQPANAQLICAAIPGGV